MAYMVYMLHHKAKYHEKLEKFKCFHLGVGEKKQLKKATQLMKAANQNQSSRACGAAPGPENSESHFLHWLRYHFHHSASAFAFLFE